eukprot:CAMPEP_0197720894 /NCGR_PEP_ID=MMETSP1434-20131217/4123_1 /TAXON_ID=265543 /ORGANISM="Minutocellus polymorphus, Strain CCMP3303" /LENGTH=74 /DNA_ID=CAMNT_0043305825 /DNA_START=293 /DNA_END=517 /DNA_ORIENTATION=-
MYWFSAGLFLARSPLYASFAAAMMPPEQTERIRNSLSFSIADDMNKIVSGHGLGMPSECSMIEANNRMKRERTL